MRTWIFKQVFSEWIPFKWIDGHKTDIARFMTFVFAALTIAAEYYPEYVPFMNQFQSMMLTVLSLVGVEVGKLHKEDKARK